VVISSNEFRKLKSPAVIERSVSMMSRIHEYKDLESPGVGLREDLELANEKVKK